MLDIHAESDIKDTQVATGELEKKKAKNKFQKGNTFGRGSRQKKESLSLPNYIKRKTKDGKMLTDFHTGIINAVDDSDEDNPLNQDLQIENIITVAKPCTKKQ